MSDEYRWHDLTANPDDMPADGEDVFVCFEYFRYGSFNCMYRTYGTSSAYAGSFVLVNGQSGWRDLKILAWKKIEPFQKKEEV